MDYLLLNSYLQCKRLNEYYFLNFYNCITRDLSSNLLSGNISSELCKNQFMYVFSFLFYELFFLLYLRNFSENYFFTVDFDFPNSWKYVNLLVYTYFIYPFY